MNPNVQNLKKKELDIPFWWGLKKLKMIFCNFQTRNEQATEAYCRVRHHIALTGKGSPIPEGLTEAVWLTEHKGCPDNKKFEDQESTLQLHP